jgi:anti-sigma B factor antagonist
MLKIKEMNSNFDNEIKDIDVVEKVEIIEEIQDGIKIFRLKGRLDSNTSPVLEDKLFQAISDGSKKIIVDFENLDYTSSAGLRVVFNASKALGREDGRLILCAMHKYIREIFKTTGINNFVLILDTMDQALKAF